MSRSKSTPEQLQELVQLFAKTPARRRYVLLRRASGELAFVQDELDAIFEQEIAAAFGKPKPRRRVIKTPGLMIRCDCGTCFRMVVDGKGKLGGRGR